MCHINGLELLSVLEISFVNGEALSITQGSACPRRVHRLQHFHQEGEDGLHLHHQGPGVQPVVS